MQTIGKFLALLALVAISVPATSQMETYVQIGKPDQAVLGLPFTADMTVSTLAHLPDGLIVTHEVKGRMERSAAGVERFEGIIPSTDPAHPDPTTLVCIIDHVKHTSLMLSSTRKTARRQSIPANATVTANLLPLQATPQAARIKPENLTTVDLGHKTMELMDVHGAMVSGTIPAGKIGNEQPLTSTTEIWVATQLKLVVKQIEKNPLAGERTLTLSNIRAEEPDPALFQIPDGYTITDLPSLPTTPAQVQALRESGSPSAIKPEPRTKQIEDALNDPNPLTKNNVAYALANINDHLSDAQTLAEQAVQLQEQTASNTVSMDNKVTSFDQMGILGADWETLGWVYYRERQQEKAETYMHAAWELKPRNADINLYMGMIYEAENKTEDATTFYQMALGGANSTTMRDIIQAKLDRLGVSTAAPLPMDVATSVPSLTIQPSADGIEPVVDILLTRDSPPSVTLLKGDPALEELLAKAIQSALVSPFPDSGPEKLLRRARLTCSSGDKPNCALHFLGSQVAMEESSNGNLNQGER